MRIIYSFIFYCFTPFIVLRLFWLSLSNAGYRSRIAERFGLIREKNNKQPTIWIHAVSVGEVQATRTLLSAVKKYSSLNIVITTMTPTGSETVKQIYGDSVEHYFIPYDLPGSIRRFYNRVKPGLLIIMETEIWPNLYHTLHSHDVPIIIVNARLSKSSLSGYIKLASLTKDTVDKLTYVLAQSCNDADRFHLLGIDKSKIRVTGNLKFDVCRQSTSDHIDKNNISLSQKRRVWIAASTHQGEETIILECHKKILSKFPDCLLILAPRHPERFANVSNMVRESGFSFVNKSDDLSITDSIQVFVLDTLGELPEYYAHSQIAFVGGSLVAAGGHNPLEPAVKGLPVIFGPETFNFSDICNGLLISNAAYRVSNGAELEDTVSTLFENEEERADAGKQAILFVDSNKGGTDAMMKILEPFLEKLLD